MNQLGDEYLESGHHYVEVIDFAREAMHCLYYIALPSFKHVDNNHKPLTESQESSLKSLIPEVNVFIEKIVKSISGSTFVKSRTAVDLSIEIIGNITKQRKKQLKAFKKEQGSTRTNLLYLDVLNETKNFVLNANNLYKSFRDFSEKNSEVKKID